MDLLETGFWTYWKPVRGPIGNRFVDLLEIGLWTYAETGSWTYQKPVYGPFGNQFVPGAKRCT